MNKAILLGRLTAEPELKSTNNGISVCTFTLAVDRRFKNANGERETDFIPIVTWRQTADFVSRYFHKGSRIALVGSIQVRSWMDEKTQNRRYATEVVADEVHFADSKSSNQGGSGDYGSRSQNQNQYSQNRNQNQYNQNQNQNQNKPAQGGDEDYFSQPTEGFFEAPDDDTALPFDL